MVSRDGKDTASHSASGAVNGWLVAILLIVVAAMVFQYIGLIPSSMYNPFAQSRIVTPRGDLAEDEKATIELFSKAKPAVAHITSTTVQRDRFNFNPLEIPLGTGSGFLWDEEGHIVTNNHVVKGATRLLVTLGNSPQMEARLVGTEPEKDIAVLKIDVRRGSLNPLDIGSSHDLQVGQKVFAIGNPFGLDQTLTTGVISGLGREIDSSDERGVSRPIQDVIQIDAAINPGNSGGPLLDSSGRVIGINTAIISPSGVYAGIGFAVPIDIINIIVPQIIRTGRAARPALGISIIPDTLTDGLRERGLISTEGVLVGESVSPSAAAAGLHTTRVLRDGNAVLGDIIIAIDHHPVRDTPSLFKIIDRYQVGQTVNVTIVREGAESTLSVVLQDRSAMNP